MKKLIIVVLALMVCSIAYADRIEDLKAEQTKVLKEIQAGQQYIQNKQIEALKIQGALEELQRPKEGE